MNLWQLLFGRQQDKQDGPVPFEIPPAAEGPDSAADCATAAEDEVERVRWDVGQQRVVGLKRAVALATRGSSFDGRHLPCHFAKAFALQKLAEQLKSDESREVEARDTYRNAIREWTVCIEGQYRPAGATMMRAYAYANTEQYSRSVEDFSRLIEGDLRPLCQRERVNRVTMQMERGISFCLAGEFEKAQQDLAAVELYSRGTRFDYWMAVCRFRGDKRKAMESLGKQ